MTALTRGETVGLAREYLGVHESPAYSNRQMFGRWYGADGVSWCAIWLSYLMAHAGHTTPIASSRGFAYCPDGEDWARRNLRWYPAGWTGAQPGDWIFYYFGGNHSPDHVELVIDRLPDGRWHTIGGNTGAAWGGSVQERYRHSGIVGFAHIDYPTAQPVARETRYLPFPGRTITVDVVGADVSTWKLYMILSGVAPEFARQTPEQFRTFGPKTSAWAAIRFKRLWNALTHQEPGDADYLDPATPAFGPIGWQCLVFSVASRAAALKH
jgi:hypothetical protein